jgi:hypothetical protein
MECRYISSFNGAETAENVCMERKIQDGPITSAETDRMPEYCAA